MIEHLMTTPNHGPRTAEPIRPRIIVLHDTAATGNSVDYLSNNSDRVSVQYVVDRDGKVYHIGRETWACWHAGRTKVNLSDGLHIESANRYSVGIEIAHRPNVEPYPAAQLRALEDLILDIDSRWRVEFVTTHKAVCYPPGRKVDPELSSSYYQPMTIRLRHAIKQEEVMAIDKVSPMAAAVAQKVLITEQILHETHPAEEAASVGLMAVLLSRVLVKNSALEKRIKALENKNNIP